MDFFLLDIYLEKPHISWFHRTMKMTNDQMDAREKNKKSCADAKNLPEVTEEEN